MTTFVQSNCDLLSLIAKSKIACDNKSLFLLFDQIEKSSDIDPTTKRLITDVKKRISEKCKDPEVFQKIIDELTVSDLERRLATCVYKMNFDQVEMILATKKILADSSNCSNICNNFTYADTTDENACRMLKMLIDYGFDWHCCANGPCKWSIINIEFPKVVELFLDSGLDVNTVIGTQSLIDHAIKFKRDTILKLLIGRGAKVNEKNKTKLSPELLKVLEERDRPAVTESVTVVLFTDQQVVNDQLTVLVKQLTSDRSFDKSSIKVTDYYYRQVNRFVIEYNSKSDAFVASFDTETSMLTVTWKE